MELLDQFWRMFQRCSKRGREQRELEAQVAANWQRGLEAQISATFQPLRAADICKGTDLLWEGTFRETYCSTSNGLERHLPGEYQSAVRYFAKCPECNIERAISKVKRRFLKHTRSGNYLKQHYSMVKYASLLESQRKGRQEAHERHEQGR
jgi:hypothetical protein